MGVSDSPKSIPSVIRYADRVETNISPLTRPQAPDLIT